MNAVRNRRVLLIDDMPSIHEDFRKVLGPAPAAGELDKAEAALFGRFAPPASDGFELDSAYQGREAAAMVAAAVQAGRPYAMAFVDMRMPPGWDGVETIEQVWRVDPQMQIVICTAHADHPWEEVLQRLNVQDRLLIVKKPFDMIEIGQLARMLTAKWELARQAESQVSGLERAVLDLKATEAALRQSNKDLEVFAHSLSHDLRTPLGIMSAFSGLLAQELEGRASEKVLHYLSRIQASAAMGEQLIEGLLVLDRVSRAALCSEPVDLSGLSRHLLEEYGGGDPRREVSVAVQDGLWVRADKRLTQVTMKQLLDNAWKFTTLRAQARIEVGMQEAEDGEPVFFVRDNGCGFDMAYADKLFRVFQRLHSFHEFPGTGVGLAIAHRAVGRHGGRIWADAKPSGGATFYFTLPSAIDRQDTGTTS